MKPARHHRGEARLEKKAWTQRETDALLQGVERWGKGKWSNIKDDPDYGPVLVDRTTVDIKDKYRNMVTRKKSASSTKVQEHNRDKALESPLKMVTESKPWAQKSDKKENAVRKRSKQEMEKSEEKFSIANQQIPQLTETKLPQQPSTQEPQPSAVLNSNGSMTLTVSNGTKNLILSVKGTSKGSLLLNFAVREFSLSGSYILLSDEMRRPLDINKTLREQVPMFDLLRVVKLDDQPATNQS